jgi:hypothetical protein
MTRTTLNIDGPVLADLKRLQRKEGKPLGDLASELLAAAITQRKRVASPVIRLQWEAHPMGARIDIDDKEALYAALDEPATKRPRRS